MLSTTDIVNTMMTVAERLNDPAPTAIQYTYGTRNDLSTFICQAGFISADGRRPSVLVQATGNFTWHHSAPYRPGGNPASTSHGTAIYLIIDQETGAVTDRGIRPKPVDLSPLGRVFPAVPKEPGAGEAPDRTG